MKVKKFFTFEGNIGNIFRSKTEDGIEEIPSDLILKLMQISIKGASDNDKIKMNTVRALGNLIQLINSRLMDKKEISQMVEKSFEILVQNCTSGSNMKVDIKTL